MRHKKENFVPKLQKLENLGESGKILEILCLANKKSYARDNMIVSTRKRSAADSALGVGLIRCFKNSWHSITLNTSPTFEVVTDFFLSPAHR